MSRPKRPTPINIQFSKLDRGQFTLPTSYIDVAEHNAYITAIEQELDEAQGALAMQTDAIQRATAAWREKTGEELVSPDTTRLVYWLLWDREDYREVLRKVSKALDEAVDLLRRWEDGPMLEDRAALHKETVLFVERMLESAGVADGANKWGGK